MMSKQNQSHNSPSPVQEKSDENAMIEAMRQLTRLGIRYGSTKTHPGNPNAYYWYPAIGLAFGLIAAIPTLVIAETYAALQGFLLFTSVLYLIVLEWLGGYRQFSDFCRICNLSKQRNVTWEQRLDAFRADGPLSAGAMASGGFLLGAKMLGLYLFYTRNILFTRDYTFLLLALILIPVCGRFSMVVMAAMDRTPGKKRPREAWSQAAILFVVLSALTGCYMGLHYTFGALFAIRSWEITQGIYEKIFQTFSSSFIQSCDLIFINGFWPFLFLAWGVFMTVFYWVRVSREQFGGRTQELHGAACSTTELAVLVIFLILSGLQ